MIVQVQIENDRTNGCYVGRSEKDLLITEISNLHLKVETMNSNDHFFIIFGLVLNNSVFLTHTCFYDNFFLNELFFCISTALKSCYDYNFV
jgi:hypothetical protein